MLATRRIKRQRASDANRLLRAHRAFLRLHAAEEKRTAAALRKIWPPIIDTILKRMDKAGGNPPVEALFAPAELKAPFNRAMTPRWLGMAEQGVTLERGWIETITGADQRQGMARFGIAQDVSLDPDELARSMVEIEMPHAMRVAVQDWLRNRQVGVWKSVAATTQNRLSSTLATGLREGDTTDQLQERVGKVLRRYSEMESRRVARTEATGSMNWGEHQARIEAQVPWKEWLATIDSRTRGADPKRKSKFDHYNAFGLKAQSLKPFIVSGQKLMYPGDTSMGASAGNVCNCRCSSAASFEAPTTTSQPGSLPIPPAAATDAVIPRIHGDVSDKFKADVEKVLSDLTPEVRKIVNEKHIEIHAGKFVTDMMPDLKGVTPRGWEKGLTWDHADGACAGRKAYVSEKRIGQVSGKEIDSDRVPGALRHELGHAVDNVLGISTTADYIAAYEKDVAALKLLPKASQARLHDLLAYYLQSGTAGHDEAFAEIFAILHGGGCAAWVEKQMQSTFTVTIEFVRAALKTASKGK